MEELFRSAEKLVNAARGKKTVIALAESCTGGMVSMALTSVPGSSDVFDRGFITYSYEAKIEMLGVDALTLIKKGAVSSACVEEMVRGAIKNSRADIAISISGIAGPGGGTEEKPVGMVYFGLLDKRNDKFEIHKHKFTGDRHAVRVLSAMKAIEILMENL